jgi:short-subunit dehydrogenase
MPLHKVVNRLAVVTGASSGIGLALARECARHHFDLLLAADRPLDAVEEELREHDIHVRCVQTDLATTAGVDELHRALLGRPVSALFANAGHGLGKAFLDQDFVEAKHVIDTNVVGTVYLIHKIARDMRARGMGRILITGSLAIFTPGTQQAIYNGTKAFLDSFAFSLRHELKNTGVTVSYLMPGVTDTNFFARASMLDTDMGAQTQKADPAEVARIGFRAMMEGQGDVVACIKSKFTDKLRSRTPATWLAQQHTQQQRRAVSEPSFGKLELVKNESKH